MAQSWLVKVPALLAAFCAPPLVMALLSAGPLSADPLPEFIDGTRLSAEHADMLADLSGVMASMSIGAFVGAVWLWRQPLRPRLAHWSAVLLAIASLIAFGALYCGLRFRYDLAQQMIYNAFALDVLLDRFAWQSYLLLLQCSLLSLAAMLYYFERDRRGKVEG